MVKPFPKEDLNTGIMSFIYAGETGMCFFIPVSKF